jgi:hypothetical protein
MEPPDPAPGGNDFGVPKMFVRWWPLWIILVILIVVLFSVIPPLTGTGPGVGTGPQSTGTTVAPGS